VFEPDQEVLEHSQGQGGVKLLLVFEVQVEGAGAQLGFTGDVFHGGPGKTPGGEDPLGRHHDLLAASFLFFFFSFLDSHGFRDMD
jgi:hypothetical protein